MVNVSARKTTAPSTLHMWMVQARVIRALVLRETQTRYGRKNIGYLWALVEPLLLLAFFMTLFRYTGRLGGFHYNAVAFLATGIITFLPLRSMISGLSAATNANKGLLLYPQVTPLDAILARTILYGATGLVVFFTVICGAWLAGLAPLPHDWLGVFEALGALMILALGLGLVQHAALTMFPLSTHVIGPLWRLLFFTSCVFYTMHDLPMAAQGIISYNPIAHGIEMLRHAYFLGFESPIHSYAYMLSFAAVCLFGGLLVERLYRYRDPRG